MTSFYEDLNKKKLNEDLAENEESRATVDKWILRLFLVLFGIMPLIILAHTEEVISPLISNVDVLSSGVKGEIFTYYKALFVLVVTVLASIMFLMKILFMDGTIRKTWLNYVIGTFVVAIVVSTIASPNISITLNGQYSRSDGAISWLCYVILMFIAMNIEYPKNVVRMIMYVMMPFVYINLVIITMNFYGKDLLQNYGWAQKLVSVTLTNESSLSDGSTLVGTLNQWNYMSGMFAMMAVMYLAWAVTSSKWLEMIVGAVTAVVATLVMLMSISTSGFLTLLAALVLIIGVVFFVEGKGKAVISLVIFLGLVTPGLHVLAEKDQRVWEESFGFFTDKNLYMDEIISLTNFGRSKAYASDNVLELPILPERAISGGSGRIYIWDKTIELVKVRAILGYGVDSLIYNFPHYNLDARSGMWDENTIIDKPHNIYVGALYGFGVIGFVMLLVVLLATILLTLKTVISKSWAAFTVGLTGCAYFAQAMFNDSLPSISSFAWVLIGVLFALTLNIDKQKVENEHRT